MGCSPTVSGFIRVRKAISHYPTMKFEYRNLGHGFLTGFSYKKQRITTVETTVETTQETMLLLIKQTPKITQAELMKKLSLTRRGVEWHIQNLKQKGLLIRNGSTRGPGGYWEVLDE